MFLIARGRSRPQLNTHARDALTCQVWARHMTKKGSGPPEGPSFPQGTKWYSIKKKKKVVFSFTGQIDPQVSGILALAPQQPQR